MHSFIFTVFLVFSSLFSFKYISYKNYVDNSFDLLCSSIKNCVYLYLIDDEFVNPYIDKDNIGMFIESYLNENVKYVSNKYKYGLYFYDPFVKNDIEYYSSVRISLSIDIDFLFKYQEARKIGATSNEN